MFTLIESKEDVARAQRKLEAAIFCDFKRKVVKNIGYPGGIERNAKELQMERIGIGRMTSTALTYRIRND